MPTVPRSCRLGGWCFSGSDTSARRRVSVAAGGRWIRTLGPPSESSLPMLAPRRSSTECAPESQVRNGLAAGGRGIRTLGPSRERVALVAEGNAEAVKPDSLVSVFLSRGDRGFESSFLQQRV